jgi:hypothetical protein
MIEGLSFWFGVLTTISVLAVTFVVVSVTVYLRKKK